MRTVAEVVRTIEDLNAKVETFEAQRRKLQIDLGSAQVEASAAMLAGCSVDRLEDEIAKLETRIKITEGAANAARAGLQEANAGLRTAKHTEGVERVETIGREMKRAAADLDEILSRGRDVAARFVELRNEAFMLNATEGIPLSCISSWLSCGPPSNPQLTSSVDSLRAYIGGGKL